MEEPTEEPEPSPESVAARPAALTDDDLIIPSVDDRHGVVKTPTTEDQEEEYRRKLDAYDALANALEDGIEIEIVTTPPGTTSERGTPPSCVFCCYSCCFLPLFGFLFGSSERGTLKLKNADKKLQLMLAVQRNDCQIVSSLYFYPTTFQDELQGFVFNQHP